MYAVIRTGGKQYRVEAGQRLRVEKLSGAAGDRVEFPDVLMIGGDGDVAVGTPTVGNARVVGEIVEQGRGRKITVFKYKSKTRYRRVRGHRQQQTVLAITEIQAPDGRSASYELRRPGALMEELDDAPPVAEEPEAPEVAEPEAPEVAEEPEAPEVAEPESAEATPSDEAAAVEEAGEAVATETAPERATTEPAEPAEPADDAPEAVAEPAAQARKTTAKKTAAKKAAAKKTAAKKTTAKKTTANRAAAKKTAAKKTAAKKAEEE